VLRGEVLWVDRFGNLVTSLPGASLVLTGSDGLVEVAVNRGRAADALAVAPGVSVEIDAPPAPAPPS
jgi:S-adenosylmethionine hydrolase